MAREQFSIKLLKQIQSGEVEGKIFSVDGHEMKIKQVNYISAVLEYIGTDGNTIEVKVDERGYYDHDEYRALSVSNIQVK